VVERVLVRRQVAVAIDLSPSHVSYLSLFNLAAGDNAIFGLLHFLFGLVELRLDVGALLQSGELCLTLRKGSELRRELFLNLQEGIQVSPEDYLEFRQALLQQKQVPFEFLDLCWVLLFFGAEVGTDENVVIRAGNCKTFPPFLNILSAFIFSDVTANLTEGGECLKGGSVDHNQRILFRISYDE
jgi:hypothetical protein